LTETLLHMLAQIPDLKVAARTSSFAFRGQNKSIQEIAAALDVAHVLEGSVQRVGDRVRITAQLIRASDGFHVWSSNFDRTLDDIFGIQDEIAEKVGYALSESLLGAKGGGQLAGVATTDPDAYDLYLQARKERATNSYGGLEAAEDLLKGALLIDPDFLDAKTELATGYIHQVETGLMERAEAFSEIMAITEQVLAVRSGDVVARGVRLYVDAIAKAMEGNSDAIRSVIESLEALVAEAPDEMQLRILLVRAYSVLQQFDEALPVLEEAQRRDPFNPQIHYELGTAHMRLEQWDAARVSLETALKIEPAQPNAYTNLADLSLRAGDGVGYVKQFIKALEVDPKDHELPGILAAFLYRLELIEEGDDLRSRVLTLAPTSEVAYRIELLRSIGIGDEEAGIASARRAIEDDIEERQFAYAGAVQYLMRAAVRNGTVDKETAYLEEHAQGVFDFEAASVPLKYRWAQRVAFDAWFASLPREELLRRIDLMLGVFVSMGIDPTADPDIQMNVLAMRGEIEAAIEVALERVFVRSVATNPGWRETYAQLQYAEIVEDPRIQAAMQRWEDEEAALRGQVQAYLEDLQAAT